MRKDKKSLAETHPEIAQQWHPTLNGDLTPEDVTPGSNKKVWWKCDKGDDHEWVASIYSRKNSGCTICSGRKVVKSNCIATTHNYLVKEWHPTKNGILNPENCSISTHVKIWWKCKLNPRHIWQALPSYRSKGYGCRICKYPKPGIGFVDLPENSIWYTNKKVLAFWDYESNSDINPKQISINYKKKVWWKCKNKDSHKIFKTPLQFVNNSECDVCNSVAENLHLYKYNPIEKHLKLNAIHNGSNKKIKWRCKHNHVFSKSPSSLKYKSETEHCIYCRSLKHINPKAYSMLDIEKYKGNPELISASSNKKIWWKCDVNHSFERSPGNMQRSNTCPICINRKVIPGVNSLNITHPEIVKQWHPTKNKISPSNVTYGSGKKVWWKCDKGDDHEWEATILSITSIDSGSKGCPICSNHKVIQSNSLATTDPNLASQWHPTKNGKLTPYDITSGSSKKVWWKCDKGDDHEWEVSPDSRNSFDSGCPICSGKIIVRSNSLFKLYPLIANEWHPTKNGDLTPHSVGKGSKIDAWWQCSKDKKHIWKTNIGNRTRLSSGCPYCLLTPQSRQELTITFELMKFFKNIDPKGFKTRLDGRLRAIDIYIPELNLCIEFDGSYWHKGKRELDKIKSEMLLDEGFKLIRVREEPLKKIYDADIISKLPYNGKQITNDILSVILNVFDLDLKLISRIKEYQSKIGLQNEKGLEKYIDKILSEKADKKSSKSKTAK